MRISSVKLVPLLALNLIHRAVVHWQAMQFAFIIEGDSSAILNAILLSLSVKMQTSRKLQKPQFAKMVTSCGCVLRVQSIGMCAGAKCHRQLLAWHAKYSVFSHLLGSMWTGLFSQNCCLCTKLKKNTKEKNISIFSTTLTSKPALSLSSLCYRYVLKVDRYGFFSGRCRYLEIWAADDRYMMPIVLADMFCRFPFFFFSSSHKILVK